MDSFRFADPWMLALLAAIPLVVAAAWPRRRSHSGVRIGSVGAVARAAPTWRVRFEPALPALRVLAVVALVVALARPQRGEARTDTETEGIDMVLAYDVSSSMTQPFAGRQTRGEVAERVLSDFIQSRQNDRVGLVAFQGSSLTLSPLTTDYRALATAARDADALQLLDGTAIGTALGASLNVLRGSSAPSRIVILLTDGENNAGELEPLAAARLAERLGVRVYTVGIVGGVEQAPRSRLNVDEESLRRMGEVTGGDYSRAEDAQALADVYTRIDALEKSRIEGRVLTKFDEIAPYLLAVAGAALALEVLLRTSVFRRLA